MTLRYFHTIIAIAAVAAPAAAATGIVFSGSDKEVIEITPEKNTGLDAIFVVYNTDGVTVSYSATSSDVVWYRYSNLGGGYAEEAPGVTNAGREYTLARVEPDMGYIIEDGGKRTSFWVADYSRHPLRLDAVAPAAEQDCDNTILEMTGEGDAIHYFTINGQQRTLSRDIEIEYETQVWDQEALSFDRTPQVKTIEYLQPTVYITPPAYCATTFTATGDRFLKQWGMTQTTESNTFTPNAVAVYTEAIQETNDDPDYKSNQINAGTSGLGGSAPAEIQFRSYCTDAVVHYEWQMADDEEFENITYRITEHDLDYTFLEEGTVFVRFVGSNSDGSCEQYGDTYTVSIGSSELKCPNAFSPGASEGVNDEWKVSYRSIIEFECWIFDRYGNEIFHFDDPEQGWDGKRGGKLVKPGVYYYVIRAKGADGKEYKKSGDINILRYSTFGNSQTPVE